MNLWMSLFLGRKYFKSQRNLDMNRTLEIIIKIINNNYVGNLLKSTVTEGGCGERVGDSS